MQTKNEGGLLNYLFKGAGGALPQNTRDKKLMNALKNLPPKKTDFHEDLLEASMNHLDLDDERCLDEDSGFVSEKEEMETHLIRKFVLISSFINSVLLFRGKKEFTGFRT